MARTCSPLIHLSYCSHGPAEHSREVGPDEAMRDPLLIPCTALIAQWHGCAVERGLVRHQSAPELGSRQDAQTGVDSG